MQFNLFGNEKESPDSAASGKTSPESSAPPTMLSAVSFQRLSAAMMPSGRHLNADGGQVQVWLPDHWRGPRGEFWMLNTSAWPNDASVCLLSSVLEQGPIPQKYYLSRQACAGILRRAEKRGKTLPPALKAALEAVAFPKSATP
jgi:hypothetical protein